LSSKGILKDKSTKIGTHSESVLQFVKRHGKEHVLRPLSKLQPPTDLAVAHSGQSCCVSWEPVKGPEDFPVTGYQIDYDINSRGWKKAGTQVAQLTEIPTQHACMYRIIEPCTCKFEMFGLEMNDEVKFRVSAMNEMGMSDPVEEPVYHTVLSKSPTPILNGSICNSTNFFKPCPAPLGALPLKWMEKM